MTLPRQPRGFMFDLDGTLILSNRQLGSYDAIAGAAEALEELDRLGIPWLALTNGSAYTARVQAPRLRDAGVPVPDDRLFTPNSVAAKVIADRGYDNVLVLGTEGVAEALCEMAVNCCLPGDAAASYADAVYVAWHPECTMDHIHAACARILDGAAFLTASDVPFFATKEGRSFGYSCAINGAINRVTGIEPEPTGKPSSHAMEVIAQTLGIAQEDVGVVGDDATAEMQMAVASGAIGIAVTSGSTSAAEWAAQPPEKTPDLVIASIAELVEACGLGQAKPMTLGFSVNDLLPSARGGGQLRMGLARLDEADWLQPEPDLAARAAGFEAFPEGVQLAPQAEAPGRELAAMLGVEGRLPEAAGSHWEDMCLLTRRDDEDFYRLVGAAVAFPTDWHPAQKMGLPLTAMHAPIQGYEEQLSSGVDHFMAKLKPGAIYGRCNWFVAPTGDYRWIASEPPEQRFVQVTPDNAGKTLFARSERQTLRRLPETQAILFTIGVYVSPLADLTDANLAKLAGAVANIGSGEGDRRGAPNYADALGAYAAQRTSAT